MWTSLRLALLAGLVLVCRTESETDGLRCKPAPVWKASRLVELRQKLENGGLVNITYMVVNSRDENSLRLHQLLEKRLSGDVTLHRQNAEDPDVWSIAQVEKDDFQIYDRCGRLTHHLSLPYTILSQSHVEEAIRNTYCTAVCGECDLQISDQLEACNLNREEKTEQETPRTGEEEHHHQHGHHGEHHHGEHHHGEHHHGHPPPNEGEGRHIPDGSSHQHGHQGQVIIRQGVRASLDLGQVQSRQGDLGQAHVGQIDLGQAHVGQSDLGQAHVGQIDLGQAHVGQSDLGLAHVGQSDLGQAHVGQIDLGQLGIGRFDLEHVADDVGNQQVMRRP